MYSIFLFQYTRKDMFVIFVALLKLYQNNIKIKMLIMSFECVIRCADNERSDTNTRRLTTARRNSIIVRGVILWLRSLLALLSPPGCTRQFWRDHLVMANGTYPRSAPAESPARIPSDTHVWHHSYNSAIEKIVRSVNSAM